MAWPFRKRTGRNPLTTRELRRLPPRSVSRHQPVSRHYPLYRQAAFPNIVTAVYAAVIREIAAKGKDARFKKTDRGMFELSAAGK